MRLGHLDIACQSLGQLVRGMPSLSMKREQLSQNAAYSFNRCCSLHGPAHTTNRRKHGPHSLFVTPSTQLFRLGFVEWLGFGTLFGRGTWFGFCLLGDGQLFGLGVLLAPSLPHHLAHQHGALQLTLGDAKSPGRNDKYFTANFRNLEFSEQKTHFGHSITPTSFPAHAIQIPHVQLWRDHRAPSADQTALPA